MNSDVLALASVLIFLTMVALVAWLGGGRKWVFRAFLSLLVVAVVGVVGVVLYYLWDEHSAKVRIRRLHECAIAKVADPKCVSAPVGINIPKGSVLCPPYILPENPTAQQEEDAIASAQKECEEEESKTTTPHDEIFRYREKHGIKPDESQAATAKPTDYAAIAKEAGAIKSTLSITACADGIRKKYPGEYTNLDNATLIKKVLAKYPTYCDIPNDLPGFEPIIEGVR
jgi:hypothetical protein